VLALIVAVIIVGAVLRAHVIGTNNRISTDEFGYALNARAMLADKPIVTFKWAPGTSLMFAAATILRGYSRLSIVTHSHGVAQYSQLFTEIVTLAVVAVIGWLLAGRWAALLAVALTATYEPLIDVTRTYLSEPLGGLALLAMVACACLARRRGFYALTLAGIVAGLAGLVREDLAIAVLVIMVGLVIDRRAQLRVALARALVYGIAALATVAPYVAYASLREHRFTPIVSAGPNALFIGTYLPGGGNLFFDEEFLHKQICHRFPKYCHLPAGDAQGMLALVQSWHPGDSEAAAAQAEAFHNLDKYMLGQPIKFAHMLWNKSWSMWSLPWSGGNAGKNGSLIHTPSVFQHQLYSIIAWLGLLGGLIFWRRWDFVVPVVALLAMAWLNSFFSITPRDNLHFMPFVFLYGAIGLVMTLRWALERLRRSRLAPVPA
jgi:hypothetical protein